MKMKGLLVALLFGAALWGQVAGQANSGYQTEQQR